MNSYIDETAIEAVSNLIRDPIFQTTVDVPGCDNVPVVGILMGDGGYNPIDMKMVRDQWADRPDRRAGSATALTLKSLCDLVNRHKDESSAVFADIISDAPSLLAVIDYHETDHSPRFGKHRVKYSFPISKEWKIWLAHDGAKKTQGDFAEFLEDHISELASATEEERGFYEGKLFLKFGEPNAIAQLSRGLTIYASSEAQEAKVLQSGEGALKFTETHKDADGRPISVPGLFMIAIPLFFGGASIRVPVRLRYKLAQGRITWSFHLYQPRLFVHNALENDIALVAESTGLPVYEGSPEA